MKLIQWVSSVSVVAGTTAKFWIGQVWDQGQDDEITIENLQVVDEDYVLDAYDLELVNHYPNNTGGDQYWDIYLTVIAKSEIVGETQLLCWINDGQDPETIEYNYPPAYVELPQEKMRQRYPPLCLTIAVENFIPTVYSGDTTWLSNKTTLQHTVNAGTISQESTGTFEYTITEVDRDDPGNAINTVDFRVENPKTTWSQNIKADVVLNARGAGLATIFYTVDNQHKVYSHDPPDIYSFKIMAQNYRPVVNVPSRTYVVCGDESNSWTVGTITNYDSNATYVLENVHFDSKPWFSYRLYISDRYIKLDLSCSKEHFGRTKLYFTVEDLRDNYVDTSEPVEHYISIKCGNTAPTVDMPRKAIAVKKGTSWSGYIGKIIDVDKDYSFFIETIETGKPKNATVEELSVRGNQLFLEVIANEIGSEDIVFTIRDKYDSNTPSTIYDRGEEPKEYTFTVKVV